MYKVKTDKFMFKQRCLLRKVISKTKVVFTRLKCKVPAFTKIFVHAKPILDARPRLYKSILNKRTQIFCLLINILFYT